MEGAGRGETRGETSVEMCCCSANVGECVFVGSGFFLCVCKGGGMCRLHWAAFNVSQINLALILDF